MLTSPTRIRGKWNYFTAEYRHIWCDVWWGRSTTAVQGFSRQWTAVVPGLWKEKWHLNTTGRNQILLAFGEIVDNRRSWEEVFPGRRFKSAYKVDETATATTRTTSSKLQTPTANGTSIQQGVISFNLHYLILSWSIDFQECFQ